MFDQLSDDWPKHNCFDRQYQALAKRVLPILKEGADPKSATFQPFADLRKTFSDLAPGPETAMPDEGNKNGRKPGSNKTDDHIIKKMDPFEGEVTSFIGVVRELREGTGKLKSLYNAMGDLGRQFLNLPPSSRARSLTIVDSLGEPNESYTCVVDSRLLDKSIKVGVMVWVRLAAHATENIAVWVADDIHPI